MLFHLIHDPLNRFVLFGNANWHAAFLGANGSRFWHFGMVGSLSCSAGSCLTAERELGNRRRFCAWTVNQVLLQRVSSPMWRVYKKYTGFLSFFFVSLYAFLTISHSRVSLFTRISNCFLHLNAVYLLLSRVGPIMFLLRSHYGTSVHARGSTPSKLLFLSLECHLKNFTARLYVRGWHTNVS